MKTGELNDAKRRALNLFDKWNDVTGFVTKHTGYYYEIQGLIEDAVECGAQAACGVSEPIGSEKGGCMNTPPTHDELVEKLEQLAKDAEESAGGRSYEGPILRATITELKRGQEDTRRLDWLEKHEKGVYTLTKTYVGGPNSELYFEGWAVGCSTDASKTLRDAIDSAISSTAKEEE